MLAENQVAYTAIMMGGQCYVEIANGNKDALFGGGAFLQEQIDNPKFPESIA